jgi:hypothetical protein
MKCNRRQRGSSLAHLIVADMIDVPVTAVLRVRTQAPGHFFMMGSMPLPLVPARVPSGCAALATVLASREQVVSRELARHLYFTDAERAYVASRLEYTQDLANYWTAVHGIEQATAMVGRALGLS